MLKDEVCRLQGRQPSPPPANGTDKLQQVIEMDYQI
jgi:hypothetical protein